MTKYLAKYNVLWMEHGALIPIQRERQHEHRFDADDNRTALQQARNYARIVRRNGCVDMGKEEILDIRLRELYKVESVQLRVEDRKYKNFRKVVG